MGKESTNAPLAMNFINSLRVEEKAAEAEYLKRNPEQFFIDTITLCLDESKKNAEVCLRKKLKEIKEEFLPEERGAEFALFKKRVASAFRGDVSEYSIAQKKLKEEARYIDYSRGEKIKIVSNYLVDRLNQSHSFKNKISFLNKFEQDTRASMINEVLFKHFNKTEVGKNGKRLQFSSKEHEAYFKKGGFQLFKLWMEKREGDTLIQKTSYIVRKLDELNLIKNTNFKEFNRWAHLNRFITQQDYDDISAGQESFIGKGSILTSSRNDVFDLITNNFFKKKSKKSLDKNPPNGKPFKAK